MTLEEAIEHAETRSNALADCKCAKEHRQLAEWLKELKYLRRWKEDAQTNIKIMKENVFDASKKIERTKDILITEWSW